MKLYVAGLGNGDDLWQSARDGSVQNILCSFAHGTSKMTADHFCIRKRQDDMKLYIAGNWHGPLQESVCDATDERNLLLTNAHKGAQDAANYFAERRFDYNLLIDSGAFTAWKMGKPIVLADYIAYAKQMLAKCMCQIEFIGLDIIAGSYKEISDYRKSGGKSGRLPTKADLEEACRIGFENYKTMTAAGIACIPTFHRDDPEIWLERIAEKAERFCLAPRVDGSPRSVKMKWLNRCFQILGEDAWKKHRIHGLGISSQIMMEAYPFYSVDSTAWLWAAQNATYRYFDGQKMHCLQKGDNWTEYGKYTKFCQRMIMRYRESGDSTGDATAGCYYYGTQAIAADVRLERHITELWASRGVEWQA